MDTRQLKHFLAAVDRGTIRGAAAEVHLSQPALTKSIRKLEETLGVRLLERSRRGVVPTVYGSLLTRYARLLEGHAEQARAEIIALREGVHGHLRVGVGSALAGPPLSTIVARLVRRRPGLSLAFSEGDTDTLLGLLRHGEIDVVLSAFPPPPRDPDLSFERIGTGRLAVVCRGGHPLARRRALTMDDLMEARWALPNRPRALVAGIHRIFGTAGLQMKEPVVQAGSFPFIREIVADSDLLSVLPVQVLAQDLEAGRMIVLEHPVAPIDGPAGLIRRADGICPPALAVFRDALLAAGPEAGELPPRRKSDRADGVKRGNGRRTTKRS